MNNVEFFRSVNSSELEETINLWCKNNSKNPISISLTFNNFSHLYVAAVVVEDLYHD